MTQSKARPQSRIDFRRPSLPDVEDFGHVLPGPGDGIECHVANRVHTKGEAGSDPEVATTTTAQRPEQVRVLFRVVMERVSICVDKVDCHQVVAREPVLSRQEAKTAAHCQPGYADSRTGAGRYRDPVIPETAIQIK